MSTPTVTRLFRLRSNQSDSPDPYQKPLVNHLPLLASTGISSTAGSSMRISPPMISGASTGGTESRMRSSSSAAIVGSSTFLEAAFLEPGAPGTGMGLAITRSSITRSETTVPPGDTASSGNCSVRSSRTSLIRLTARALAAWAAPEHCSAIMSAENS